MDVANGATLEMADLVEFVILVQGARPALGHQKFRVAPRVNEHIYASDNAGTIQIYQVIAVIHSYAHADVKAAGYLVVKHVGTETEFYAGL